MPLSPESRVPGTSLKPFPAVHRYTTPLTWPARTCWNDYAAHPLGGCRGCAQLEDFDSVAAAMVDDIDGGYTAMIGNRVQAVGRQPL